MSGTMKFTDCSAQVGLVFEKPRLHSAIQVTNQGPRTVWCVTSTLGTRLGRLRIISYWKLTWQDAYASWLGEVGRCLMLHSTEIAKEILYADKL